MDTIKKYYWLDNLFDEERIALLLRFLPKTLEYDVNTEFDYNGKRYRIEKDNKNIILTCNDGRKLMINIDSFTSKDKFGEECLTTNVDVRYILFNSVLNLRKMMNHVKLSDFEDVRTYIEGDKYNCSFNNLNDGFSQSFVSFTDGSIDGFIFSKDGIKYGDYLISKDCEHVVSKGEIPFPSLEEINNFSLEDEKNNYIALINNSNLSSNMKQKLINNFNVDDLLQDYKGIKQIYRMLPGLKSAVLFHQTLVSNDAEKYIFNQEELDLFIEQMAKTLKSKIIEYDDNEMLITAKKMIMSLSNNGLVSLKKMIDEKEKK